MSEIQTQLTRVQRNNLTDRLGEWLTECYPWDFMVTFTIRPPKIVDKGGYSKPIRVGPDFEAVCGRHPNTFFHKIRWYLKQVHFEERARVGDCVKGKDGRWRGRAVREWKARTESQPVYVIGLERGARFGRLHAHAVVRWPRYQHQYEKLVEYRKAQPYWDWGYVTWEVPRDLHNVGRYVSKYVVKEEDGDMDFSPSFRGNHLSASA